jgi:sulfite dehydrogenase (cytochrome) subunit B
MESRRICTANDPNPGCGGRLNVQTLRVLGVLLLVGLGILGYALWGRSGRQASEAPAVARPGIPLAELTELEPVKDIELEYHTPDMPPGPGHEQFVTQCVICHSPRYVLNQPIFPRKTWVAEVHKMVKVYGAPISVDEAKDIVEYLVSWHGKENAPATPIQNTK